MKLFLRKKYEIFFGKKNMKFFYNYFFQKNLVGTIFFSLLNFYFVPTNFQKISEENNFSH